MAVFNDMHPEQKVTIHDKGVTLNGNGNGNGNGWPTASYGEYLQVRFGDTYVPRISSEEPLRIQCRHFARCVRGTEEPRAGGAHGVEVVDVLEALQRSLTAGGEVLPVASAAATR
jgi:predicted dehydrogenase